MYKPWRPRVFFQYEIIRNAALGAHQDAERADSMLLNVSSDDDGPTFKRHRVGALCLLL